MAITRINQQQDLRVARNLSVGGDTEIEDLNVGGDLEVTGDLEVGADAEVGNDLAVGNDIDLTGDLNAGANVAVVGDGQVDGNLDVGGDLSVIGEGSVDLDLSVGGDLNLTGDLPIGSASNIETLHSETLAALAPTLPADELTILDDANTDAVTLNMIPMRVRMGVFSTAATEFFFSSDVLGDIYAVRDDGVAGAADLHVVLQGDGSWRLEVLEAEVTALGFADGDVLYTPAAFVERLIPVYVVTAYSGDEAALNVNAGGDALVAGFTGAGHAGDKVIQVSTTAAQRPPELPTITP